MLKTGETFPEDVAGALGVKGKNAVVFFYGADGSPSCTKEVGGFSAAAADFKALNFEVVGVRSAKEAKGEFAGKYQTRLVADEGNALRTKLAIKADLFGALAGRETYVIDKAGSVKLVFNDQFKAEDHVTKALAAAKAVPQGGGGGGAKARQGSFLGNFQLPNVPLPSFGSKAVSVPLVKSEAASAVAAKTGRQGSFFGDFAAKVPKFGTQAVSAPKAAAPVRAAPAPRAGKAAPAAPAAAAPAAPTGGGPSIGGFKLPSFSLPSFGSKNPASGSSRPARAAPASRPAPAARVAPAIPNRVQPVVGRTAPRTPPAANKSGAKRPSGRPAIRGTADWTLEAQNPKTAPKAKAAPKAAAPKAAPVPRAAKAPVVRGGNRK
jgi:peroxiredoxin